MKEWNFKIIESNFDIVENEKINFFIIFLSYLELML